MTNLKYFVLIFFICTSSVESRSQSYPVEEGWGVISADSVGFDDSKLLNFWSRFDQEEHRVHSMLVLKSGKIIYENYYNGQEMMVPHDLRSSTKSILAILMGIAIEQGFVNSVEDPFLQYLSQKPDKKFATKKIK